MAPITCQILPWHRSLLNRDRFFSSKLPLGRIQRRGDLSEQGALSSWVNYTANLRDIEFCLFELLEREAILATSIYSDLDRQTALGMLAEMKRLAEDDLAAPIVDGDRLALSFDQSIGQVSHFGRSSSPLDQ